jgi:hypothetical protein
MVQSLAHPVGIFDDVREAQVKAAQTVEVAGVTQIDVGASDDRRPLQNDAFARILLHAIAAIAISTSLVTGTSKMLL